LRVVRPAGSAALLATLLGCGVMRTIFWGEPKPTKVQPVRAASPLATPAERSAYTRTATTDQVVQYLNLLARRTGAYDSLGHRDSLLANGAPMDLYAVATSVEGRDIPVVVAARPMVRSGAEAHAEGRVVVYVQADIHGGEVDGKDALLAFLRDILIPAAKSPGKPSVLDSLVLVVVPVANPDGNDSLGSQSENRPEQLGPDTIGVNTNARGLNLNRDFVKAEAPETEGTLSLIRTWDPDVFVDLHTTDGSFHGYALTYAPPQHPAAVFTGPYTRDSLLPVLHDRMRDRHRLDTFDYGNFVPARPPLPEPDITPHRWETFDYRARFGTNYIGLRNRIAILSEAYSHDSLSHRVASQYAFVREILSLVAERGASIRALVRSADSTVTEWGADPDQAPDLPLAAVLVARGPPEPVEAEDLERIDDTTLTQPGVPRGVRRTGRYRTLEMPVMDRFEGTRPGRLPGAYLMPMADSEAARLLTRHGILVQRLVTPQPARIVEHFVLDSVVHDSSEYQGHHVSHPFGHWLRVIQDTTLGPGTYVIPCAQPLAILAYELLEPESADGFVTWNIFDAEMQPGHSYPVARLRR
jgi:hypothetical protein